MVVVALLWQALAAWLFEKHFREPLIDHGPELHDRYFLPTPLWQDFSMVLRDLSQAGFDLPEETYRAIWEWRFPEMLGFNAGPAKLSVRKGHEGWPLLCETPLEGGTTSRFVDTSMERIEFTANSVFVKTCRLFVQGRELRLETLPGNGMGAGLRYRRTALAPSLHPGIPPHVPLLLSVRSSRETCLFKLEGGRRMFQPIGETGTRFSKVACKKLRSGLLTYDLRLG